MEEKKYNITNHALERYAERMAGKVEATNMRIYVSDHKNDISDRIHKLINYGELIFEGKIRDYSNSQVYYKDHWVIIVDPKNNNVVTLYKIDLGDDEVNDLFANKTLAKIEAEQNVLNTIKDNVEEQKKEWQSIIDNNDENIAYHKKMIKSLEQVNESYRTLMKNATTDIFAQNKKITDLVELLIAGRKY